MLTDINFLINIYVIYSIYGCRSVFYNFNHLKSIYVFVNRCRVSWLSNAYYYLLPLFSIYHIIVLLIHNFSLLNYKIFLYILKKRVSLLIFAFVLFPILRVLR